MRYCCLSRNHRHLNHRPPARLKRFAVRYATSSKSGCIRSAVLRKRPSTRSCRVEQMAEEHDEFDDMLGIDAKQLAWSDEAPKEFIFKL